MMIFLKIKNTRKPIPTTRKIINTTAKLISNYYIM
jgi:hypothetical protein